MTSLATAFDAITEDDLRRAGGLKWTAYPEATGAFVAEMDFGVAPEIRDALHTWVDDGLFGYPPAGLTGRMTQACADWQRDAYGWDLPTERVRPLADVLSGLSATIDLFTAPGSAIVLPTPAYMPFLTIPAAHDREVIQVPMLRDDAGWHLDLDGIDRAFAAGGGLLVFCNPHNPIGKVYTRDEMLAVAEVVARHGARVFSDEIHSPLVYPGASHVPYASVSDAAASHTITATSASKAWNLPGLKCAQLILSSESDAEVWSASRRAQSAEHGASNPGLVANVAAYDDARGWLADVIGYLDGNRRMFADLVAEHLPGAVYLPPEGTYLAWLDCRELGLGDHPTQFFLEQARVAATDGALCGDVGAGCVRFNLATPRPILRRAVERMGQALAAR
ncbi:MalY/PatB family protein [Microbacterium luticocti]|uniref:MalY/PatB family protein n=1 Tax=Microbacterium luticocti TaxID=451764 RepID=UPI00048FA3B2|nr:aminotransferase class I/II-fold pyridoxal phosphate-dependent enzyme [Microbacterium luticocti]